MFRIKIFIAFVLLVSLNSDLLAQIQATPNIIFIDPRNKSGELELVNKSEKTQEVELEFKFGYLSYDSTGTPFVEYGDSLAMERFSLEPYVKCYPRKCILDPGESQMIRFLVRNASNLEDGMYWTRAFAKAKELDPMIDSTSLKEKKIAAKFVITIKTTLMVVYRKGEISNQIEIAKQDMSPDGDKLNFDLYFKRNGNAPFLGNLQMAVYNDKEEAVYQKETPLPIYFDCMRRFPIDKTLFPKGKYILEYKITNEHNDIDESLRIDFDPIEERISFDMK